MIFILKLLPIIYIVCFMGCANSVTNKFESQKELINIEFTIEFNEALNVNDYSYLIVFSRRPNPTPVIALPEKASSAENREYLPFPSSTYDDTHILMQNRIDDSLSNDDGIHFFYKNYFQYWTDFIIVHKSPQTGLTADLIQANESSASFFPNTATKQSHTNFFPNQSFSAQIQTPVPTKLQITFDLQELFPSQTGTLYATIVTVDTSQNLLNPTYFKAGRLADYLTTTSEISSVLSESLDIESIDEDNTGNTAIPGSADIVYWRVRTF